MIFDTPYKINFIFDKVYFRNVRINYACVLSECDYMNSIR